MQKLETSFAIVGRSAVRLLLECAWSGPAESWNARGYSGMLQVPSLVFFRQWESSESATVMLFVFLHCLASTLGWLKLWCARQATLAVASDT